MKGQTIRNIIVYFLVFIIIIGVTSTFIAKDFIDQAREISLTGEDMLCMQASLNNANLTNDQSLSESDEEQAKQDKQEEEKVAEEHREVYEKNDSSEKIKEYQKILVELEYLNSKPDGVFGPMTLAAVKGFQAEENIEQSGKLDIETQKLLEESQDLLAQNTESNEQITSTEKPEQVQMEQAQQTKPKQTEHIVRENETLSKISQQYGVSLRDIYQANNFTEESIINIKQKIIIPFN